MRPRNLKVSTKPKIVFVRTDHTACAYYRIFLPCHALKARGWQALIDDVEYEDFEKADILVFQRQSKEVAIREIFKWKSRGKKIVFDFDDNIFQLDPDNPAVPFYNPEVYQRMKEVISIADAVTVSTPPLIEVFKPINEKVFVLPNQIHERTLQKERRNSSRLVIGWQGSGHHLDDLRLVRNVVNYLSSKFDFDFVLAGSDFRNFFRRGTYRPWVKFSENLEYFSLFEDFSIGICPLRETPFSECKSDIKFLEYSALGIATIASKVTPYYTIKDGQSGYLARNKADWEGYLAELITDKNRREEMGAAAREYVASERTIQGNTWRWEEIYSNL